MKDATVPGLACRGAVQKEEVWGRNWQLNETSSTEAFCILIIIFHC